MQAVLFSLKQDTANIRENLSVIMDELKDYNNSHEVTTSQLQNTSTQSGLKTEISDRKTVKKRILWPSHRVYEGSGYQRHVVSL